MARYWNKTTKQVARYNRPFGPNDDPAWVADPVFPDGANPRHCVWDDDASVIRAMTPEELAALQAAAESLRQARKPDAQKANENEYLALLDAISDPATLAGMGLTEVPRDYSTGLGEYIMHLADALAAAGDLVAYHAVNAASQRLMWLGASGVNVNDIPAGGHVMPAEE